MSNSALVSFRLEPDRYAVLKALAEAQGLSLSHFVRDTVERALDLDEHLQLLAQFFRETAAGMG